MIVVDSDRCRPLARVRASTPWQAKLLAKILAGLLPVPYATWRRLTLFRHGQMQSPVYALAVFRHHLETAQFELEPGATVLELGPGDSVFSALVAAAYGAERTVLVDVGDFVDRNVAACHAAADWLAAQGALVPGQQGWRTFGDVLATCRAQLLTKGIESLRALPSGSVDFVWSQAVLEHVPLEEVVPQALELRRILKPAGVVSHRVDLTDHLSGGLESLRFGSRLWESSLIRRSGTYTNRLRPSQLCAAYEAAGFAVSFVGVEEWERPPIRSEVLADAYRRLNEQDLLVRALDFVARPVAEVAHETQPPPSPDRATAQR